MKSTAYLFLLLIIPFQAFPQEAGAGITASVFKLCDQSSTTVRVDTLLTGSQIHQPLLMNFPSWSELGNTGLPALPNRYRPVREASSPLLFEGFDPYRPATGTLEFISAANPFSMVGYSSGGAGDKNGQTMQALFAKDIRNNGNITVRGRYFNSDGHFNRQKGNASDIRVNYRLIRKSYSLNAGLLRNNFSFDENGGLRSDDDLELSYRPNLLGVRLSGAHTKASVMMVQGVQSYSLSRTATPDTTLIAIDSLPKDTLTAVEKKRFPLKVTHTFRISDYSHRYTDTKPDSSFYRITYGETGLSNDSLRLLAWTNDISLVADTVLVGKLPLKVKAGVNPDLYRYQHAGNLKWGFSAGLNASARWEDQFSEASVEGHWTAAGYTAGDYDLRLSFVRHFSGGKGGSGLGILARTRNCSPDPIVRNLESNHFRWTNDFSRQSEHSLEISFRSPARELDATVSLIRGADRIYFDTLGLPAQDPEPFTVYSAQAAKGFGIGPFRTRLFALLQYSDSETVPLPLAVASASLFMNHLFKFPTTGGQLEVEYGFDATYASPFKGFAYMPATGAFHLQESRMLGNYPGLNLFAQMKVKRTRIFVQWCNTLADLLSQQSFSVLHYPSMRPHFKYGIYWHFYD